MTEQTGVSAIPGVDGTSPCRRFGQHIRELGGDAFVWHRDVRSGQHTASDQLGVGPHAILVDIDRDVAPGQTERSQTGLVHDGRQRVRHRTAEYGEIEPGAHPPSRPASRDRSTLTRCSSKVTANA